MQIKISTRHGHLAEETQQYINDKVGKLLHYFDRLMMIEVTVDLSGDHKNVEVLVSAEHKHDFVASEEFDCEYQFAFLHLGRGLKSLAAGHPFLSGVDRL